MSDVLAGGRLEAANLELLVVVDGEFVILVFAVEFAQLLGDAIGRNVREQKGNGDEAGFGLAVSLDDEHFAVPAPRGRGPRPASFASSIIFKVLKSIFKVAPLNV